MMLATSPLLQLMTLSTRACVGIPSCDRDCLCSEILHTGTMKLGREWSLPSRYQLGRCFRGKCHMRLKNGLQKNEFSEFWCRFQWRIYWNKSGGSYLPVAWDMTLWSWWHTFGAPGKERINPFFPTDAKIWKTPYFVSTSPIELIIDQWISVGSTWSLDSGKAKSKNYSYDGTIYSLEILLVAPIVLS